MIYDYSFFHEHSIKRRNYYDNIAPAVIGGGLFDLYGSERAAKKHHEVVSRPHDIFDFESPSHVRCRGAYSKGGQSVQSLEESLQTKLPEDFKQFYEQFGESVIFTRTKPIWLYPLNTIIQKFEDDPDIEIKEGRFFRFAKYPDPLYLGLRRQEDAEDWNIVVCTYGLLYSEMIGQEGRSNIVSPSFYDWLNRLILSDGFPDDAYPYLVDDKDYYLHVADD